VAQPASAQYFGRNKVQYETFEFRVLKTEHFDIYYYPEEQAGAEISARLAERWYARLSRLLVHQLRGRQPLVLYGSHPDFSQSNVIQGEISEGTGGVTEPLRRRIIMPLGGPLADTDHVLGHELVHAFQFDMTTSPDSAPGYGGLHRLPLWFVEGMAEYLSIGPVDANTAMWLRDAARHEQLPAIKDLNSPKYFPYRWGQAFWAYVAGRFGEPVIPDLLTVAGATGDVDLAIQEVLGVETSDLSKDWQAAIHRAYGPVLAATTPPEEVGRVVVKGTEFGGDLNVGPAISPDGRMIAFLSARSFFSVDLYVADVETGRTLHKLTSTATDPHFASIQFIYSAGAWDRASRHIAIATISKGRPALAVFDVESGRKVREASIATLDEIFNPTWAPDGRSVAFTGMSQGLTDLYVYDLQAGQLTRLTDDAYAELQPAWSPDGTRIAFATDRFTTDLSTLHVGPYRLALVDPRTKLITAIPGIPDRSINPQWAPEGDALYFISSQDGIPNLFRAGTGGEPIARLTNVGTGLSGITASSPALSVSEQTGMASFTLYGDGKYHIYRLNTRSAETVAAPPAGAASLPSSPDRGPSEVLALAENPTFGLPAATEYPVEPYKTKLSLEAVGQPTVGVGLNQFGPAFGGGMSFYFRDLLGNHTLSTGFAFNSLAGSFSLKDLAAQVGYFNQAHRWNWGVVVSQSPYLSGGYQIGFGTTPEGIPVQINRTIIFRQTEAGASGIVAYPFDQARRVEFSSGFSHISFDQIVQTATYSLLSGGLISEDTTETSLAPTLTLGTSSAAYVHDTTSYGATSPVQGQRYRFEASPTFGTINFTGLLADYRRYFMPAPFYTIAVRGLQYGRYGSGSEDFRLYPLYIGYPSLIRGYDVNSFTGADCVPDATSDCPLFDRLNGSRAMVLNLEFRFPLLRPFGVTSNMYGPLPVEVALFADGGVAWTKADKPSFLGGSREGVSSVGVGFRVNLAGFAVGEFDFVRPLQRPRQGWMFQFNLSPGW
jgi:Tol biopolymer transport system component